MNRIPRYPQQARARRRGAAAALLAFVTLAGCGSTGLGGRATTSLRPDDFAGPEVQTASAAPAPKPPAPATGIDRTGPVAASEGIFDVYARIGSPTLAATDAGPVEDPRLVQAKVGDINGRAVYAMDFLAPMEARLKAQAAKLPREKWMEFATKEIRDRLELDIADELLMAEARESLTPEQKQGFFAVMEDMRAKLYSENRGSKAAANKKLFEDEGVNEEQWLRTQEQKQLIRYQLYQMIEKKTVVSWREIQQQYDKDYKFWNPPPKAFFHLILVSPNKTAEAAQIQSALEAGEDFVKLASSPANEYKRATAGLEERIVEGEFSQADFFGGLKEINEAARRLEPGQWVGPVTWDRSSVWIYLERVDRQQVDLYTAQLKIEQGLRDFKAAVNRRKYLDRIKARSSITDVDEMTQRLVAIAAERYLPPAVAAKPGK